MNALKSFEDLDAWKAARELTNEIHAFCRREPLPRDFGPCNQLRRAPVSVMNNISEGWESSHVAEKIQFYNFARRSCGEVRSMSYVLVDNHFVPTPNIAFSAIGAFGAASSSVASFVPSTIVLNF